MPLIDSMKECCHSHSTIIIGMTREFIKPLFFKLLAEHFLYNLIFAPDMDNSNIGIFVCYPISLSS